VGLLLVVLPHVVTLHLLVLACSRLMLLLHVDRWLLLVGMVAVLLVVLLVL
jgi:hypothetical protein